MNTTVRGPGSPTQGQIDALVREAFDAAGFTVGDQVWSWRSTGSVIELRADLPPVADPRHRPLMLAGGAVLLNLRLLIRGLGLHPAVRLLPSLRSPDVIAAVRWDGPRSVTAQDRSLVAALLTRSRTPAGEAGHLGPNPFALQIGGATSSPPADPAPTTAPPASFISAMRRAAKAEQAWLAIQPVNAVQGLNRQENSEPGPTSAVIALIIGTVLDSPAAQLQAGQAAHRVLLTAAALGAPITPLRSGLSTIADRRRVRELIGGGLWPQAVLHPVSDRHPTDAVVA